jgi:hypothetical protein
MENNGPVIDEKIKDLVSALRRLDIPTTGSCEGHKDHGAPAPWIKITPGADNDPVQLQKKVTALLDSFYKDHVPEEDARFVVENANFGFWIHNGGKDYVQWRKEVAQASKEPAVTGTRNPLTPEEQQRREKKLPAYQREALLFAEFLNSRPK